MGLPGLQRLDHIGFTVPDLARGAHLARRRARVRVPVSPWPLRDDDGDWMAEHLDVDPRTVVPSSASSESATRPSSRSSRTTAPDQRKVVPRNSDLGGHHVALYVDDLDAPSPTCGAGRRRARRADRAGRTSGPAVGLLPFAVGDAVRAGLLPEGKAFDHHPEHSTDWASAEMDHTSIPTAASQRSPRTCASGSSAARSSRASGSARRRSPSGSAPAGCRCARRCACSRPRGSSRSSRTRAHGSRPWTWTRSRRCTRCASGSSRSR